MAYVAQHLLPNERVQYQAHLHKIVFVVPTLIAAIAIAGAVFAGINHQPIGIAVGAAVALIAIGGTLIPYRASEFAVTDKRVVMKTGIIQRRTLETMLSKVEAISVDQSIMGRLLNYGTIVVVGTGGTREQFTNISRPLEFRRQVQVQVAAAEDRRVQPMQSAPADRRDERECPYCAEVILAKARVCKHCGRDVAPLTSA
jgi:uncharacterized membrane protein YdbT with pleckstrin-like domain